LSQKVQVEIPEKLHGVFSQPRGEVQYRAAYGGRGSGKSYTFALMAALWGLREPIRILATRDFQSSIKESFHAELKAAISSLPWLEAQYEVGVDYLRGKNGTEFIFRGLRHNIGNIKSLAKIDLTIVEEAEDVSEESWLALEATVFRQKCSELWAIWNPCRDGSPVDNRFRKNPPKNASIVELNYYDNPFFPEGLEKLRKREEERLDPQTYAHIWLGDYLTNSTSQVLHGKVRVSEFEPQSTWSGPYYGMDWGFSQDPTVAIRCWVNDGSLYVEYEAGKVGLELDETPSFFVDRIPDIQKHNTRADSARPESISHVKRHGLPRVEPVKKWPGGVEDGISHLRQYKEIIIHPRCHETIRETRLYSYKVDRLTGDVLPTIVDEHNHYIDAIRYALNPLIKSRNIKTYAVKVAGL
jgi:phage terminase large subunit